MYNKVYIPTTLLVYIFSVGLTIISRKYYPTDLAGPGLDLVMIFWLIGYAAFSIGRNLKKALVSKKPYLYRVIIHFAALMAICLMLNIV